MERTFINHQPNPKLVYLVFGQQNFEERRKKIYYCYDPSKYPEITWKELEGEDYDILETGIGYSIVRYKGKTYVVYD